MVSTPERSERFRPDIQALRAVAVVAVVVYHLWPDRLPGGFVGVDVFFVISGYLIVGNLLREVESTGRIRLGRFWVRRARRLLPASLTVLALTAIAVYVWVPQTYWMQFLREIIASTLYVQNWVLAADSVDYLARDNVPSPVQHFWSLSVEEQFYIVTPVVMIALVWLTRRRGGGVRGILAVGLGTLGAASLVASIWMTATAAPAAYFATTTRAWEFAVGGLLAFLPSIRSSRWGSVSYLGGAGLIAVAGLLLSASVPFPSVTAAWPVAGAVLMIAGGASLVGPLAAIASARPVQFVGDVSYSAYLWHWPLIVILPFALGGSLALSGKLAVLVATFVLAWASTRFLEDPVRYSALFSRGRMGLRVLGAGTAAMVFVVALSGIGIAALSARLAQAEAAASAAPRDPCFGAPAALDPDCGPGDGRTIVPDPLWAPEDDPNRPECWAGADEATFDICTLGDPDAEIRLAAFGDSHNNALISAYERIAAERGWRIDVAGHNGCYWTGVIQIKPTQSQQDACEAWKDGLRQHLASVPEYDAILVTNARITLPPAGEDWMSQEIQGLVTEWSVAPAPIIVIRDVPRAREDVVACVSENLAEPNSACSVTQSEALGSYEAQLEAAVIVGAPVVDLTDAFCWDERCNPVIGGVMVYRDPDHITGTFAQTLAPILGERIEVALRQVAE